MEEARSARRCSPSKNQLRIIAVLVRYTADPQRGLPARVLRKISNVGDKSNARRAVRAPLSRGVIQRSKDGERLRLPPYSAFIQWSLAPYMVDPPLDDGKAQVVLKAYGEV